MRGPRRLASLSRTSCVAFIEMSRPRCGRLALSIGLVSLLCAGARAEAQAKDDFVRALIDLSQAVGGATGREGPALQASLDAMAKGLAEWDAAVSRVEAGFAGAIKSASPAEAARMRATLAATYLDRGRVADAVPHLDQAVALDPSFVAAHLLRGLAYARLNRTAAAAAAYAAARKLEPASVGASYLYLSATREAARSGERGAALEALLTAVKAEPPPPRPTTSPACRSICSTMRRSTRRSSCRRPTSPAFVCSRRPDIPRRWRASARRRPRIRWSRPPRARRHSIQPTNAPASPKPTRWWHPAIGRRRAPACSTRCAGSRTRGWHTGVWDGWPRMTPIRRPRCGRTRRRRAARPWQARRSCMRRLDDCSTRCSISTAAARSYERRVTLAPRSAPAHLDLGRVYQAQDRLDDALAEYLAAALVDPASAGALAAAGQLRADLGDDEGAIALLRLAVRRDANHGEARYALGRALLRVGRVDESRDELTAFERIQKAEMDAQRRRFEENARALDSALRAAPPAPTPAGAAPKDAR